MNSRKFILLGGILALSVGIFACLPGSGPDKRAQRKVEETRRVLREGGFKLDLTEFAATVSPEILRRSSLLVRAGEASPNVAMDRLILLQGIEVAKPVWKQTYLAQSDPFSNTLQLSDASATSASTESYSSAPVNDLWPEFRVQFLQNTLLDEACAAAIAGPIQFDLQIDSPTSVHLNHLSGMRQLSRTLASRVVLDLHDGEMEMAWTNLLAATRLATAWKPEPADVSHLVRANCIGSAFNATWEFLQSRSWTDEQLATLQHEWESLDLWKNLPETAAFSRASTTASCRLERNTSLAAAGFGQILRPFFHELTEGPVAAVETFASTVSFTRKQSAYLKRGTYDDEIILMQHFRDRENLWKSAVLSPNWKAMRSLGVATNEMPTLSKFPSQTSVTINLRQGSMGAFGGTGSGGLRRSFAARIADAEARRAILIAALALARYELKYRKPPQTLAELAPEFCPKPPMDFMDGKPLRYPVKNEKILLYSVGVDCTDDGGKALPRERLLAQRPGTTLPNSDVIWPRALAQ